MKNITCVIDNTVKRSSKLHGEHGLAFLIKTEDGGVLFDTGRSGKLLLHNMDLLEINPQEIGAVVLSHAHIDHTGGLSELLLSNPGLPLYANPDLFRPRFSYRAGQYQSIGMSIDRNELIQLADVRLDDKPVEVLPGLWTSGEITKRSEQEGRSARHVVPEGDGWIPDPYQDDMSMVMDNLEGLVLICGCCHAGLLNTMAHVQRTFQRNITAVLGGTHLVTADEPSLKHIINILRDSYDVQDFYLNHCTGEYAFAALVNSFGRRLHPCPVGTVLDFNS